MAEQRQGVAHDGLRNVGDGQASAGQGRSARWWSIRIAARLILRDTALVGLAGCLPWLAICIVGWIYRELFDPDFWMDRAEFRDAMMELLLHVAAAGTLLGLLSSVPVRLSRNGFRFIPSCLCIASVAFSVRLLGLCLLDRIPAKRLPDVYRAADRASLLATVVAAVIASAILTAMARRQPNG